MTVVLPFEDPVNITATDLIHITWDPDTFDTIAHGNFSLNLWLLHNDDASDIIQNNYVNLLLTQDQNVYNNSVWWMPSTDSVDINVPQPGKHQLAWEKSSSNPDATPNYSKNTLLGFSSEFNIFSPSKSSALPASATSALTNLPSTSRTSDSTSISPDAAFKRTHDMMIGFGIALGITVLLSIAAIWILVRWGKRKRVPLQCSVGSLKCTSRPDPARVEKAPQYEMEGTQVPVWHEMNL